LGKKKRSWGAAVWRKKGIPPQEPSRQKCRRVPIVGLARGFSRGTQTDPDYLFPGRKFSSLKEYSWGISSGESLTRGVPRENFFLRSFLVAGRNHRKKIKSSTPPFGCCSTVLVGSSQKPELATLSRIIVKVQNPRQSKSWKKKGSKPTFEMESEGQGRKAPRGKGGLHKRPENGRCPCPSKFPE